MRTLHLSLKTAILNRPSFLAEAEVEAEVVVDKEAVEVETLTKANRVTRSLMTQTEAREEEVIFVAGGAKEDAEIKENLIRMQTMVAGHVESQTTLKETVLGKNKETAGNRIIMHLAVIEMIQRGFLLCSI